MGNCCSVEQPSAKEDTVPASRRKYVQDGPSQQFPAIIKGNKKQLLVLLQEANARSRATEVELFEEKANYEDWSTKANEHYKQELQKARKYIQEGERKLSNEEQKHKQTQAKFANETSALQRENQQLKQEKESLLSRLSRMDRPMVDALTDDIPNATELSDQNRPTKLAEHYQEIYDNEWTDAFEILDSVNKNEELTIDYLIRILKETWKFCEDEAGRQTKTIQEAICSFPKDGDMDIPTDVRQQIKDCRRNVAVFSGKQLFQKYQDTLTRLESLTAVMAKRVPNFVKECFNICWLMTVQDPQMVFGWNITKGDRFDTDMYKVYTKRGSKIDFVVWPVLLLHTNGPVLTKGIAQGHVDNQPENSDKVQNSSDQVWGRKQ